MYSGHISKIVMTTVISELKHSTDATHNHYDAYITKPIQKMKLLVELRSLKLIQ